MSMHPIPRHHAEIQTELETAHHLARSAVERGAACRTFPVSAAVSASAHARRTVSLATEMAELPAPPADRVRRACLIALRAVRCAEEAVRIVDSRESSAYGQADDDDA